MTVTRLVLVATLASVVALVTAGPSQAGKKPDYCRWAPHNAHICWYYHGGAFRACDDQADHHRVRAWIRGYQGSTTDPNSRDWYVKVTNKTRKRKKACTAMIHEPGGPKHMAFWQFRLCTDHEGCTRWRYAEDGSIAH